jgi:hypothetical protein
VLWGPDATLVGPGMLHRLHLPAERLLHLLPDVTVRGRTVDPDPCASGNAASQRFQQEYAACMILESGLLHQHLQDPAHGLHKEMLRAPFHVRAAVRPASPPL